MAPGTGLSALLGAVKANAVAVAVAGTVAVGGVGAAAVATGTVHLPTRAGNSTTATSQATALARACAHDGDATRLAATYTPMFDGSAATARTDICGLFATGASGHAFGYGEVQQVLNTAAAIETTMDAAGTTDPTAAEACLSSTSASASAPGQSNQHGKPTNPGQPSGTGQPSFTAPQAASATTMEIVQAILKAVAHGTPLAQLAHGCGADPGNAAAGTSAGQSSGSGHGKPSVTPGAKPAGTPGSRP